MREDKGNSSLIIDPDEVDALMNAVVETADIKEVGRPGIA